MLGYVTIHKNELKIREYEVYQAYYCGICKAIGRRHGQLPRLNLSYDGVFLAMILSGLDEKQERIEQQHCIVHPIKRKPVVLDQAAVDYAADVMVILAYHKFLDDWKDEKSMIGFGGKTLLARAYKKLSCKYPSICKKVEASLADLSRLEKEKCQSLDVAAESFADVMEVLFTGYIQGDGSSAIRRIMGELGRQLGRWIYVMDALDDYEEDRNRHRYNPLIYRGNHLEGIRDLLYNYLGEIMNAYDLLHVKKNQAVIENIIFMGLRQRTDMIVKERIGINE